MDTLHVTYLLDVEAGSEDSRAENIALEQTVEVPRSAICDAFVLNEIQGRVEEIVEAPEGGFLATIAYSAETTALDPAQLINVVFGNSSLYADIQCVDIELPTSVLVAMQGPQFGISGIRKAVGIYDRPLTCTAIKPMGLSPDALADLLRVFARAGIDVIKDDHGLADHRFCPFEQRVSACLAAVEEVADATGHHATYVPNLIGTPRNVFRQLAVVQDQGVRAVMVSPMLIGLPAFWELCHERASVPVLAHPAFGGAQRIAPQTLFGKIFRLYGADAVIFVNFGSRFSTNKQICRELAEGLVAPWSGLHASLPAPAGGIALENVGEVLDFYGPDTMMTVGGNLQVDPTTIPQRSREFADTVRRHFSNDGGH
ncbi:MAG: RuBisCO large subunit C-terminal-like domain-containing protein [Myxococcota bacterium]